MFRALEGKRGGQAMKRRQFTPEKVIELLRQAEVESGSRQADRRGLPRPWHLGAELLPLAQRIWRPEARAGVTDEGLGEGERPAEKGR